MHSDITFRISWSFLLLFICFALNLGAEDVKCYTCHEKERISEQNAIHIKEGVACVDCHGGNPESADRTNAHGGSFSGKIQRQNIPALCGSCHSDVRKMNPYGIPTDQQNQYLSSKHGEALSQGKTDVAVCVDCHGAHGILKVGNPGSPVYPKNIPGTCGKCHSDAERMKKHELPASAEGLYRQSVHAELLLKKDDLSAPTCVTCHGNHGAIPPGFSEISHVCGKCHIRQQELFAESPHAAAAEEGIFESCVTCHTNHKILTTTNDIFKQCTDCHEENDAAMNKRDEIFSLIHASDTSYQKSKIRLDSLARFGFHTDDEQLLLEEAKTSLLQLPPVQHTLNLQNVQKVVTSVDASLNDLNQRMDQIQRIERLKKIALIPIGLFLIGMSVLFWAKRKEIEKESGGEHE